MRIQKRTPWKRAMALLAVAALAISGCGITSANSSSNESAAADAKLGQYRFMVPNSPGGGYDTTARTAAKIMEDSDLSGRSEVFNVTGAGGTVGLARLMNEEGNDNLVMMMGLGVVGAAYTNKTPNKLVDSTPLVKIVEESEGIVVPADSPYETIQDLMDAWKADPSKLSVGGGSSPGGPDHLFPMQLGKTQGIDATQINYITYDGGGELLPALLGSKIAFGTSGLGEYRSQISGGQIRVLAVSGENRIEGIDAPTLKESGIDLTFTNWRGIIAPPGISDSAKNSYIEAFTKMRDTQEWKDALAKNGWEDAFQSGDEFAAFLEEQDAAVAETLQELGLA